MTILGVDTSLRSSGFGLLRLEGTRMIALDYGIIRNKPELSLSACLVRIGDRIRELIEKHNPDAVSVEGIFLGRNTQTMMILAHARGVVIETAARAGVPVHEYSPRRVKSAVTGYGGAEKEQVQQMIRTLLALSEKPQNDAADALALAITHLHNRTSIQLGSEGPI